MSESERQDVDEATSDLLSVLVDTEIGAAELCGLLVAYGGALNEIAAAMSRVVIGWPGPSDEEARDALRNLSCCLTNIAASWATVVHRYDEQGAT